MKRRKKLSLQISRASLTHRIGHEGGLFEDEYSFPGTTGLTVYDASGQRIARWEALEGVTDDEFLEAMEALLARKQVSRIRLT